MIHLKMEKIFKYLKYFKHKFLIVNIKSEGIETKVLKFLKQKKITNYFFLRYNNSFYNKLHKKLDKNIAVRVSDIEDIQTANNLKVKLRAWLDFFKN